MIVPYDLIIDQATHTKKFVLGIIQKELHLTGVILIGALAMVIFLAVFVSRRLTGPVTQLSNAATKLSRGDYQTRVNIHTGDEFQELGNSFNSMIEELKLRQNQLVQANKLASLGVLVAGSPTKSIIPIRSRITLLAPNLLILSCMIMTSNYNEK
ncbi:MAG: HAMP domain-containing protein [Desulfobacterales bacterium]|nr:HAMP domain-containing protein [Desulfobacterales bacterium]